MARPENFSQPPQFLEPGTPMLSTRDARIRCVATECYGIPKVTFVRVALRDIKAHCAILMRIKTDAMRDINAH